MRAMAHLKLLLLLLWLGLAAGSALHRQKRLIGGQPCQPDERPFHVKLVATNGKQGSFCGGSLISDRWILTAAHCWKPGWTMTATVGVHPNVERPQQIIAPPVNFVDSNRLTHDIMLLQLPAPSKKTPVALPDCNNPPPIGASVQMAGHGANWMGLNNEKISGHTPTLQCADFQVVDCTRLRNIIRNDPYRLNQHWFCMQSPGKDTCPGDSGGGVVYKNMIYGVHAFTGNANTACAEAAGVMDVCGYIDWIRATIGLPNNPGRGPG